MLGCSDQRESCASTRDTSRRRRSTALRPNVSGQRPHWPRAVWAARRASRGTAPWRHRGALRRTPRRWTGSGPGPLPGGAGVDWRSGSASFPSRLRAWPALPRSPPSTATTIAPHASSAPRPNTATASPRTPSTPDSTPRSSSRPATRRGADAWDAAAREGSALSFEDAIAYALQEPPA